jgi:hypothetical protein
VALSRLTGAIAARGELLVHSVVFAVDGDAGGNETQLACAIDPRSIASEDLLVLQGRVVWPIL